jgi:hypothetical protein
LKNFYLATRWLNTVFPLYYQGKGCEQCLLDKPDWLINFIAASYISNDMADNQELKNLWAKIYKVISFFKGLRADLTYLDYNNALKQLFGENYKIEDIFKNINQENIDKIQNYLIKNYSFLAIEGTYNRSDVNLRSQIGLRLLQESYWPNDFIFSQLSRPNVAKYTGKLILEKIKDSNNVTFCSQGILERCIGISLDVINLIYPISAANSYFLENTSYENYLRQVDAIKKQLNSLPEDRWYANTYWETLVLMKSLLGLDKSKHPIFMQKADWQTKDMNNVSGAWVNLQLPADQLEVQTEKRQIMSYTDTLGDTFIEPNQNIIQELIAHLKMMREMLESLGVIGSGNDQTYKKLTETITFFEKINEIVKKELISSPIEFKDQREILETIEQISISKKANKTLNFQFKFDNNTGTLFENIEGIKILLVIYKKDDKLILAAGPVFNYQESRR